MVESKNDIDKIKKVLDRFIKEKYELTTFRKTTLFRESLNKGLSVRGFAKDVKYGHLFKNFILDYQTLLEKISQ